MDKWADGYENMSESSGDHHDILENSGSQSGSPHSPQDSLTGVAPVNPYELSYLQPHHYLNTYPSHPPVKSEPF